MSQPATKEEVLRNAITIAYQMANDKRMEIGACLFSPSRLHHGIHNAKRLAALAADLVEITARLNRMQDEYYGALDK
jgi:hypothetical protein